MSRLSLSPLSATAFAPYGTVIAHEGNDRRHFLPRAMAGAEGLTLTAWVSRIHHPMPHDFVLTEMERHPYSDQLFVPLSGQRYIVIVCDDAGGQPDSSTLKGFVTRPGQGVMFRRMVWHAGMQVLDAPAEFFVQMNRHDHGGDDEFRPLLAPVAVLLTEFAE